MDYPTHWRMDCLTGWSHLTVSVWKSWRTALSCWTLRSQCWTRPAATMATKSSRQARRATIVATTVSVAVAVGLWLTVRIAVTAAVREGRSSRVTSPWCCRECSRTGIARVRSTVSLTHRFTTRRLTAVFDSRPLILSNNRVTSKVNCASLVHYLLLTERF